MQTKLIEIQAKTATVYFLGDIHEGAANHQAKALAKAIDIIANDSNAYWIGMGDYIDAINHRDPLSCSCWAGDPGVCWVRCYGVCELAKGYCRADEGILVCCLETVHSRQSCAGRVEELEAGFGR
ncbi:MAG: hypothetical protein ACOX38_09345 [Bacillota bacterium]